MSLTIRNLADARIAYRVYDAVLTIEDVVLAGEDPDGGGRLRVDGATPDQLILRFEDLDEEGPGSPTKSQVEDALAFARKHQDRRLLIHCVKGQARSPAIALAIFAERLGAGQENAAVQWLLAYRPDQPGDLLGCNLGVIRIADETLGRGGALAEAWAAYERSTWNDQKARYRFWRKEAPRLSAADEPGRPSP